MIYFRDPAVSMVDGKLFDKLVSIDLWSKAGVQFLK